MVKAVILAGGLATRLRPLTLNRPKALVPVLNRPFLEHMLHLMGRQGVQDIVLALGNLAKPIQDYFGDGSKLGLKVGYAVERFPLGTAGATKNAAPFVDDTFIVLNGDIFIDIAIAEIMALHRKNKALVTIAAVSVDNPAEYGLIETDNTGRITRFMEKPSPGEAATDTINAGLYVMEPEVLRWVPAQRPYSFEKEVFPQLLAEGLPMLAYNTRCYWIDIGTPERYLRLNQDLLGTELSPSQPLSDDSYILDPRRATDLGVSIKGQVMVGKDTIIEGGATLEGPAVIGPSCHIRRGCVVARSVLWQEVRLDPEVTVDSSVIADHSHVGARSYLERVVVGDHVSLPPNYQGKPGSRIPTPDA